MLDLLLDLSLDLSLKKLIGLFLLDRLQPHLPLARSLAGSWAVDLRAHWWRFGEPAEPQGILLFVVKLLADIESSVERNSQLLGLILRIDLHSTSRQRRVS